MSILSLPKRLSAIAELVPKNSRVADIGTDHALLPIFLIQSGMTNSVIASDIVDGPLESAEKNIKAHGLADKITVVKSDGLVKVCPLSPETVIIAGMGGETIRDIMSACDYSTAAAPLFILQPMTHTELLREYLIKSGFSILSERVIQEQHRFYVIIETQHKKKQEHYFKDIQEEMLANELGGITLKSCDAAKNYLLWRKQTAMRARDGLLKSQGVDRQIEKFNLIIQEIDKRLSTSE